MGILNKLIQEDKRRDLARTTKDVEILKQLSTDKNRDIRSFVAKNANTPADALKQLATDDIVDVRYYVAQNVNTPADALKQLATDADTGVRYFVAKNANTPVDVLKQLSTDDIVDVRNKATEALILFRKTTADYRQERYEAGRQERWEEND